MFIPRQLYSNLLSAISHGRGSSIDYLFAAIQATQNFGPIDTINLLRIILGYLIMLWMSAEASVGHGSAKVPFQPQQAYGVVSFGLARVCESLQRL